MPIAMGLLRNEHGVYYVRKKVPRRLERAVAQVLGKRKERQTFLKQSLRTKELHEARRKAPEVLLRFDSVLERARLAEEKQPLRTTLTQSEIDQLAEHLYGYSLMTDAPGSGGRPK